jgi:Zn-dependent protease/CBS domain-containing protein
MNSTFRIGNLFGIPFYLHISWFLVLGLITWDYGQYLAAIFPSLGPITPWILGLITALLLFASVLAHELGHSIVAIKQGIEVKSITLFLFGGLANLDQESKTPGGAFLVAIAGPLVSLILCGLFTIIAVITPITGPLSAVVQMVALINLALAIFNLIPGLPLDGGNILKALVWKITGNPYKGILVASRGGQVLGIIAIISGIFGSFWNILIGWFILANANQSVQYAKVQIKLSGLTAADAVTPNSPIVLGQLSIREFANDYIIGKTPWSRFLVTDDAGKLRGELVVEDIKNVPTSHWPQVEVKELMKNVSSTIAVQPEQSLLEVAILFEQLKVQALPVIRDNGVLVGLIEKSGIIRLLEMRSQAKPA